MDVASQGEPSARGSDGAGSSRGRPRKAAKTILNSKSTISGPINDQHRDRIDRRQPRIARTAIASYRVPPAAPQLLRAT